MNASDPVAETVEYAVELHHFDGRKQYTSIDVDKGFAVAEAHAMNEYVASLNEPTRQMNGIESARPVSREVRNYPDGSKRIGPWKPVEGADQ